MSELGKALRSCRSPVDLMTLAGLDPEAVTSPAIVVMLLALYGQPPRSKADRALWTQLSGMPWPNRRMRRALAVIGRRGLKSSALVAWVMIFEALCVDYSPHVAAGSRVYLPTVAPRIMQAGEATNGQRAALELVRGGLPIAFDVRNELGSVQIRVTEPAGAVEVILAVFVASEVSVRGFAVPFFAIDEAGFFQAEGASSLASVLRAMRPGGATFPGAGSLLVSSPGAPEGAFFSAVTTPPKDTLLIRAPTWVANPRVSRETCVELADGDAAVFASEYEASRFGWGGEGFIDVSRIELGDEWTGLGPREGIFPICAFDIGQLVDSSGFLVMTVSDQDVPGSSPVRHFIVEHVEEVRASKTAPWSVEQISSRAVAIADQWGRLSVAGCPLTMDGYVRVESNRAVEQRGYRLHDKRSAYAPVGKTYVAAGMSAPEQTPRWFAVRSAVSGGRLHIPNTEGGRELVRQLGQLTATSLASGMLKVEGTRDDLADCLALAIAVAQKLPPSRTRAKGCATIEHDSGFRFNASRGGVYWEPETFTKTHDNGDTEVSTMPPRWHPSWEGWARASIARGEYTREIDQWLEEQAPTKQAPGISMPVRHG